jgi:hypothetical protein
MLVRFNANITMDVANFKVKWIRLETLFSKKKGKRGKNKVE